MNGDKKMVKKDKIFYITRILLNEKILLGLSFIILSIFIPLVQMKIDYHSSRLDNYRFLYQQSMLKHSLSIEKYDSQRFLSYLLGDKYIEEKHGDTIFKIIRILNEREKELLVDSITSTSLYPESSIDDYRNLRQKYSKESLVNLRTIDIQQVENNILTIKNNIENDKKCWNMFKILLYFIGTVLFFIPTIRGILK